MLGSEIMLIRIETTISFDPVDEYVSILKFKNDNDMNEYTENITTECISFKKVDYYSIGGTS